MAKNFVSHRPKGAPVPKPVKAQDLSKDPAPEAQQKKSKEIGGPCGPEPTRYGDWERKGICVDF